MATIDIIIIVVYLSAIVVVGLVMQKKRLLVLIHIFLEIENYLGGHWVHLVWPRIRILLVL